MKEMTSREETDAALGEETALLFKYSMTCPISANARQEMDSLLSGGEPVPVYRVDVNARREVSDYVAERTGVQHESPQVILLRGGRPVWDADRFGVTAGAIREQLGLAAPGG
ncbi:bacillithiol system redox-active protein YtxJ [Longimicrobium sp.]|uniref:bacillithiol system redox-active protein YtxJ n=1 Tax=Longimicrobium sp. TaxID=2029185 RepID=UPI002C1E0FCD|nr:bacillithiol system redox-active protein YtxJ [Longimicrobium sp.]HSU14261.1 bacillithiol system redox-active protein YtxJ [Longimicrobium sp.]